MWLTFLGYSALLSADHVLARFPFSILFRDIKVGSCQGSGPLRDRTCSIKAKTVCSDMCLFSGAKHPSLKFRFVQLHGGR